MSKIVSFEFVCATICRVCKKRKVDDERSKSTWRRDRCFQIVRSKGDVQEKGIPVVLGASSDSSVPVSFLMSSRIFLVVNSPVWASERWERWETSTYSVFAR